MLEKYNQIIKKSPYIIILCIIAVITAYAILKLALYLLPFVLALALSTLIEPIIKFFIKKFGLPRKISTAVTLLLMLVVFGFLTGLLVFRVISEVRSFYITFPHSFANFYNNINNLLDEGSEIYLGLPEEFARSIDAVISNISLSIMNIINTIFQGILNTAVSIPETIIFIVVTILSTYFLSSDREKIYKFFKQHLPAKVLKRLTIINGNIFTALFGYVKALLILMAVTFTILCIGFLTIGVKYALMTALFICLVDALPILGTGTIMIPWALYEFLTGQKRLGLYILVIYGVVVLVRQLIEPKVVGKQIGVHPLLTLLAMYAGLKFLGVLGMFAGPIIAMVLKSILEGAFKDTNIKDVVAKK
ncbi:MAG TPA: sporulation integral membrane protein YtvI [Clostridia bacterium]|nr:sporulation integral membrane protein YtvI [Clostridia bacterium]